MSSKDKNLSVFNGEIPKMPKARIAVVVSEWNTEVTGALLAGAQEILQQAHVQDIRIYKVPGSYELIHGANVVLSAGNVDAVVALGCVIQGETRHFDFICQAVADGLARVSTKHVKPVVFGVLTTDNQEQALERAGGKHGNKGAEAAYTALRMIQMTKELLF
jgi:6,7-dimethyl-8-ribityllumazine synthase